MISIEFAKIEARHSSTWPRIFSNVSGAPHSFDHVRLRVSGDPDMTKTWAVLDKPLSDSLATGLVVTVAFNFEEIPHGSLAWRSPVAAEDNSARV